MKRRKVMFKASHSVCNCPWCEGNRTAFARRNEYPRRELAEYLYTREEWDKLVGITHLGGDAVEDERRLYDGEVSNAERD